ncbi:MAG: hypothetical protein FWD24_03490 [Treponema sp.]|nr:hypothetical protein [Treponema sp.]
MKNIFKVLGVIALVMVIGFSFMACPEEGGDGSGDTNDFARSNLALRAVPIPASDGEPWVIGSYSEGDSNFYLIDVGTVLNVHISTIANTHFNGTTPVHFSRTTVNQSSITQSLTSTISNTVTFTDTNTHKVGIQASWKKKFPIGTFSAKASYDWTGTVTNTRSNSLSTTDTFTTAEEFTESITTSFTVGGNGEPAGWHRYALYATSDVYFLIETSLDNQVLKGWETLVCARQGELIPKWDYSSNGIFDNSPIGEITFAEDFYKNLPPVGTFIEPPSIWPNNYLTDNILVRNTWKEIDNHKDVFGQHHDLVNFNVFGIDLETMIQQGYKTIHFFIKMDVRRGSNNYGEQRLHLFHSPATGITQLTPHISFWLPSNQTSWTQRSFEFNNVSINNFISNEFVLRYSSLDRWWYTEKVYVQLLFKK